MNVNYVKRISQKTTPAQANFAKWEVNMVKKFIKVK